MNRKQVVGALAGGALVLGSAFLFTACEIDSAETSSRNVNINVAGFYAHPDGGRLVGDNTGNPIVNMDLRQSGDELEGVDNNGNIFKGTIGQVDGTVATINLTGITTAGQEGTISGSIEVSSTEATSTDNATMRGTWIEPTLTSTVYGQAVVPQNTSCEGFSLTADDTTLSAGETANLSVSGGTSPYTWSGGVSGQTTNPSNTYTATGTNTSTSISVTDANGCSDSVTITIN